MLMVIQEPDGTVRHDVDLSFTPHEPALELRVGEETTAVRIELAPGYLPDAFQTMQALGVQLERAGRRLVGCGTCARFQFSRMSRESTAGRVGYCQRVGNRVAGGHVDIRHRCGEYRRNEGWEGPEAWKFGAVMGRRDEAEAEGRLAAFEGAMVGLAVGDPHGTCGERGLEVPGPDLEASLAQPKGAGAPMRVVAIGLRYGEDRERLLDVARASSLLAHGHPAAVESSAAVALAVSLALNKQTPEAIHAALLEECGQASPALRRRLEQVPELLDASAELALGPDGLGESRGTEQAVASALWCFWRSPADFRRTVFAAVATVGASDTVGCIAGGISGAFNGIDAIPREWREAVDGAAGLREIARRLSAATSTRRAGTRPLSRR